MNICTFGYGEETDDDKSITVCASYIVAYVTDRGIEGVILIITSAHRDSSLVTTENDWDQSGSVCFWILRYGVLDGILAIL